MHIVCLCMCMCACMYLYGVKGSSSIKYMYVYTQMCRHITHIRTHTSKHRRYGDGDDAVELLLWDSNHPKAKDSPLIGEFDSGIYLS
jgi:hypothetical protein